MMTPHDSLTRSLGMAGLFGLAYVGVGGLPRLGWPLRLAALVAGLVFLFLVLRPEVLRHG